MSDESIKRLANAAGQIAVEGAFKYIRANKLNFNNEALVSCLQSWIKIKMPEALKDAKEALACNMGQIAEATFAATMVQAGIEAAKEASIPSEVQS